MLGVLFSIIVFLLLKQINISAAKHIVTRKVVTLNT